MFVLTIVWGIGYLIIYPGMGNYPGLIGWTQVGQYEEEVAAADEKYRAMRDRYLALPIEEIAKDPAVRKMGMRMFANNCAQCHGGDARGSYGFPNLADNDWLYGGTPAMGAPNLKNGIWLYGGTEEQIGHTLRAGRNGVMPAFGDTLSEDKIHILAAYVYSLSQ